jgi:FMN-dependent NADH-azoreductase
MKLLRIDSSARRSSISRQLTSRFVEAWKKENPDGEVIERDLATTPLPLITDEWTQAAYTEPSSRTASQREAIALSEGLVEELLLADTIVIGAPMYNFAIPWPLKAWIDQIVRAGKTFARGANGYEGLILGKKVVIITSRGGSFARGTSAAPFDYQEPYLRHILGFIGLTDVTFIHAENQSRAELAKSSLLEAVKQAELAAAC